MNLRNDFTDKTRALFLYNHECWWCHRNRWDAIHHILGRCSDSPLNAAPIHNFGCHLDNGELGTFDKEVEMLAKTYWYLLAEGYLFTAKDKQFIKEHHEHYSEAGVL
jgi:hypothetical protein